jgi:hypothetical protein
LESGKALTSLRHGNMKLIRSIQPNYFFDKLRGAGLNLVAMEGGPAVESVRKLFHEQMSTKAVQQWSTLQASNAAYTSALLLQMTDDDTVADVVEK